LYRNGTELGSIFAPISHASSSTSYGVGNATLYGHVKLSDSITDSGLGVANGTAATPKAIFDAITSAKAYADSILSNNDAMVFKGTIGTGGTVTQLPFINYSAG
jgi:hypothetical protein